MMFVSRSAQVDPDKYQWFIYKGQRAKVFKPNGFSVKQKKGHHLRVNPGDMYGTSLLRNGRYRVVHGEYLHIIYNLDEREANLLTSKSRKTRKKPKLKDKVSRAQTKPRQKKEQLRFKAGRRVTGEKTVITKSNYQWRKTNEVLDKLKSPAGVIRKIKLPANQIVGIRFEKKGRGGVLVLDKTFKTLRVHTDTFDDIVNASTVLPRQPKGQVKIDDSKPDTTVADNAPVRAKRVTPKREVPTMKDEFLDILKEAETKETQKKQRNKRQRRVKRVSKPVDLPDDDFEDEQQHKDDTVEKISGRQRRPRRLTQGETPEDNGLFEKVKNLRLKYEAARRDKDAKAIGTIKRQARALAKKITRDTASHNAMKALAAKLGITGLEYQKPEPVNTPEQKETDDVEEIDDKEEQETTSLDDLDEPEPEDIPDMPEPSKQQSWNADDFEPADIVVFEKDVNKREFIILDAFPDQLNDRITKYHVYNISEEPEYIQTFRLTPLSRRQSLPSKARLVRKATRQELAKYRQLMDTYEIVKKSPYKE